MIPSLVPLDPGPRMSIESRDLALIGALRQNIEKVIIGKSDAITLTITALLARGHLLIEDIPGIGKTAMARSLAKSVSCTFKRIQFTPDLLPSDITGLSIFDQDRKDFVFRPGPIFANIILADEINRTTPRTQSSLLEAMNEARVSVDGTTHDLPRPFMVIATQNPHEFTGTYPLPESQLDRFLMIIRMGYPTPEEEARIVASRRAADPLESLQPAISAEEVNRLCDKVQEVRLDDALAAYIVEIAHRTRQDKNLVAGVSPRGTIQMTRASRAHAMVLGRDFVAPDDVKAIAPHVLSHRLVEKRMRASQDGRATTAQIIRKILEDVPVPQ